MVATKEEQAAQVQRRVQAEPKPKLLPQNCWASLLLPLALIAVVSCSSTDNTPTDQTPMDNGSMESEGGTPSGRDPLDEQINQPIEKPLVTTDVASMLPGRATVFGEDINTFPNPNQILGEDLLIWRYRVVNDQIVADEFEAPLSHQLVWQRYSQLVPAEYRPRLTQVSFEADPKGGGGSEALVNGNFFETTPGLQESWLYFREPFAERFFIAHQDGVLPQHHSYTTVFIHEQAHIIHNDQIVEPGETDPSELYLISPTIRRDSVLAPYYEKFWLDEIYEFWRWHIIKPDGVQLVLDRYPNLFVSDYATTNIHEDFAESFAAFVEADSIPSSGSDYRGAEKIIWFWSRPEYVALRDYMRAVF